MAPFHPFRPKDHFNITININTTTPSTLTPGTINMTNLATQTFNRSMLTNRQMTLPISYPRNTPPIPIWASNLLIAAASILTVSFIAYIIYRLYRNRREVRSMQVPAEIQRDVARAFDPLDSSEPVENPNLGESYWKSREDRLRDRLRPVTADTLDPRPASMRGFRVAAVRGCRDVELGIPR